jgi:hypothetical protein
MHFNLSCFVNKPLEKNCRILIKTELNIYDKLFCQKNSSDAIVKCVLIAEMHLNCELSLNIYNRAADIRARFEFIIYRTSGRVWGPNSIFYGIFYIKTTTTSNSRS